MSDSQPCGCNDPDQHIGGMHDHGQQRDSSHYRESLSEETDTYETITHLLRRLHNAPAHIPEGQTIMLSDVECERCTRKQGRPVFNTIALNTLVILCNADGVYGQPGFFHGTVYICPKCRLITQEVKQEIADRLDQEHPQPSVTWRT
jgi:hypothetical protein